MGHLNRRELQNLDERGRLLFAVLLLDPRIYEGIHGILILIGKLNNTPDAAAKQAIILFGVFIGKRDVLQAEIGKLRFVAILFDVQLNGDLVDDRIAASGAQMGKDFLRFIRAHEVVRQNMLDRLYAPFDDGFIITRTILSQKEFEDIDGHIGAFLDLLGQILAYDFPVKVLLQLFLDAFAGAGSFIKLGYACASCTL